MNHSCVTNADAKDRERKERIGALTVSQNTKQGCNSGVGRQKTIMSRLWIGEYDGLRRTTIQRVWKTTTILL